MKSQKKKNCENLKKSAANFFPARKVVFKITKNGNHPEVAEKIKSGKEKRVWQKFLRKDEEVVLCWFRRWAKKIRAKQDAN